MTPSQKPQRSALGLVVLGLLVEEPMHVYRMQQLIESYGKHRVVNVRSRASLYQTIERLTRLGLVEVRETLRTEGRPDRTIYAITDQGREVAGDWLREMLRETGNDYPEFVAAVSMMFALTPEDARAQLEHRTETLANELDEVESMLASVPGLPRLFMIEEEYRKAVLEAQVSWLRGIVDDLQRGRLTWSEQWLREVASTFRPPHDDEETST
jgi:DNA-binding PadR family transcriptional regulator